MAKRKATTQVKSRSKPKARQPRKGLFHFSVPRFVWRIILVAVIVGVLYWQWPNLTSWAANIIDETLRLFGWGILLLVIIALSILGGVLWRQKQSSLRSRFRQWLGCIAFTMAFWGILAFFALGGKIGLSIIGYPDFIGILRIAGLFFVGVILVAPGACLRAAKKANSWLRKQLERRPAPRPVIQQEPTPLRLP